MAQNVSIPDSHKDLITGRVYPVVVTLMPDGQPQAQVVWADLEGDLIMFNTEASRQKVRNMQNNPRVTLVWMDPQNPDRYLEVRGMVESMSEADGVEKINHLSQKYDGKPFFDGPTGEARMKTQRRVTVRVRPTRVVAHT